MLSEGSVEPKEETLSPSPTTAASTTPSCSRRAMIIFKFLYVHILLNSSALLLFLHRLFHPPLHTYKNSCSPWPKSWRHTPGEEELLQDCAGEMALTTTMPPHNRRPPILR